MRLIKQLTAEELIKLVGKDRAEALEAAAEGIEVPYCDMCDCHQLPGHKCIGEKP